MNREEFKDKAKQAIDDVFSKIDEVEQKSIAELKEEAKENYQQKIKNLETQKEELKKKYEALESSSGEKWDSAKEEFSKSVDYLKKAISEVVSIFKKEEYEEDEFVE